MSRARIRLRSYKGIPENVRRAVRHLLAWLRVAYPPRDAITVTLVPQAYIWNSALARGRYAAGCILLVGKPTRRPRHTRVYLAGGITRFSGKRTGSERGGISGLLEVACHEYAHYTEWREGLKCHEGRARARARRMMREYREAA